MIKNSIYELSTSYFETQPLKKLSYLRKAKSSWKLVDWVIRCSGLTGNAKLVAAAISSFYDKKLGYAYVSFRNIEAMTGLSESSITRAVRAMRISGEWVVINIEPLEDGAKKKSYTTWRRYIPLSPLKEDDKKDLNYLNEKFNAKNVRNKNDHTFTDKYFRPLWQSDWPGIYLRHSYGSLSISLGEEIESLVSNNNLLVKKIRKLKKTDKIQDIEEIIQANSLVIKKYRLWVEELAVAMRLTEKASKERKSSTDLAKEQAALYREWGEKAKTKPTDSEVNAKWYEELQFEVYKEWLRKNIIKGLNDDNLQ